MIPFYPLYRLKIKGRRTPEFTLCIDVDTNGKVIQGMTQTIGSFDLKTGKFKLDCNLDITGEFLAKVNRWLRELNLEEEISHA